MPTDRPLLRRRAGGRGVHHRAAHRRRAARRRRRGDAPAALLARAALVLRRRRRTPDATIVAAGEPARLGAHRRRHPQGADRPLRAYCARCRPRPRRWHDHIRRDSQRGIISDSDHCALSEARSGIPRCAAKSIDIRLDSGINLIRNLIS